MTSIHTSVVDQPVEIKFSDVPREKDLCGILPYATALKEFILQADTPLTISLQGEWGSGKTSLMHFLKHGLSDTDSTFYAIEVNTWQHAMLKTPAEAIVGILQSIISQLGEVVSQGETSKEKAVAPMWQKFTKVCKVALIAGGNVAGNLLRAGNVGSMVDSAASEAESGDDEKASGESQIAELKKSIQDYIAATLSKHKDYKGFIFFIDDLDRIDPPLAVQLLELLKNIFDLEHCIYILAIDYDVVIKGLKPKFGEFTEENAHEFRSFFDKIIQLPFKMPISNYNLDNYLTQNLKHIGFLSPEEEQDSDMIKMLNRFAMLSVGMNPRSLKRLTNILSLINLMTRKTTEGGLSSMDKQIHFALVCLQIAYPQIYDMLAENPDFLKWTPENIQKNMSGTNVSLDEASSQAAEPWKQALSLRCSKISYLLSHKSDIIEMFDLILDLFPGDEEADQSEKVGAMMKRLIHLSDVTNVTAKAAKPAEEGDFNYNYWLKEHRLVLEPLVKSMLPENMLFYNVSGRVVYDVKYAISNKQYPADYPNPGVKGGLLGYVDLWRNEGKYHADFHHDAPYLRDAKEPDRLKAEEQLGHPGCMDNVCRQIEELRRQYPDYSFDYNFRYEAYEAYAYSFRFETTYASAEEMVSHEAVGKFARVLTRYLAILEQLYPVMVAKGQ